MPVGLAFGLQAWRNLRRDDEVFENLKRLGTGIQQGDADYRVTNIDDRHDVAEDLWNINGGRDQIEAFFLGVDTAFTTWNKTATTGWH